MILLSLVKMLSVTFESTKTFDHRYRFITHHILFLLITTPMYDERRWSTGVVILHVVFGVR